VKALLAQLRLELALTLRNGESLLLTMGIPVGFLVFFSMVDVLPIDGDAVDFLAPGVLAMAVLATGFANLAIATGFDRSYGVLKRLGATPLGRERLVAAKVLATLSVLALQAAVVVVVALALGWRPNLDPLPALAAVVLATMGFVGMALLVAGRLPALVGLAASNAAFLVLLMLSGMVFPLDELPAALRALARALPSTALAEVLHDTLSDGASTPAWTWLVLAGWAVAGIVLATRLFRWEPDQR
jgi:ABC-2 type transport system permease protein